MKIGIFVDIRFTALKTPTGVTKHIVNMIEGLASIPSNELIILAAKDQLTQQKQIPEHNLLLNFKVRELPYTWHQIYWMALLFNIPAYDNYTSDLDWVYCPKNDYLPLRNTKFASTFHGAHELDPAFPNPSGLYFKFVQWRSRKSYQRIINQASLILTVSEFLKQKTLSLFKVDPSKIKIVGNGIEEIFYTQNSIKSNKNYLLSVGGLNFLDGGDYVLEVANLLKKTNENIEIHIAGNQNEPALLKKAIEIGNVKMLGYLNKEELAQTMSQSIALLYLTRYETFGIAAGEAMASGLPIITINNTAVPEIVKDAGYYVTPESLGDIIELIHDQEKLNRKVLIGKQYSNSYKWSDCVSRLYNYLKLYEKK